MMRAVREQPRLVAAKALGMLCLVGCGLVLGLLLGGGGNDTASRTAQLRLTSAERTLRGETDELRQTRALLARSRAARARIRGHLRASTHTTAKLRRQLRVVRRALVRARKRP